MLGNRLNSSALSRGKWSVRCCHELSTVVLTFGWEVRVWGRVLWLRLCVWESWVCHWEAVDAIDRAWMWPWALFSQN